MDWAEHVDRAFPGRDAADHGSRDFAYYGSVAPAAFAFIGSGSREAESDFPHHHPRFTVDERALGTGLRFFLEAVERTSSGRAELPD